MKGSRLDQVLAERGLAPSRAQAQALVLAGLVRVDGQPAAKAGTRVPPTALVEVTGPPHPSVSRGGVKLAAALDRFGIDPAGLDCIDIGASTGGFTDCLLQRGARRVVALDVGHGQLDWRLRQDERVIVLEGLNARHLTSVALASALGSGMAPRDLRLAVVDVSFISLRLILPALGLWPAPDRVVCLVKPQFEVGPESVGRGGIVRDPELWRAALRAVAASAPAAGWRVRDVAPSALPGSGGNREFFLDLHRGAPAAGPLDPDGSAADLPEIVAAAILLATEEVQ